MKRRPFFKVSGVVLSIVGAAWAAGLADRSGSWDTTCYEDNICDSLTFTVAGELLREGVTPYQEQTRRDHISRTRLSGSSPPFDLPFQYPPNALPLFALRTLSSPRVVHVGTVLLTTLVGLLLFWRLVYTRLADDLAAVLLMAGVSLSAVVAFNAQLGQTGLLAAALVLGIVLWWRSGPVVAGVLLGALTFKPQYAAPIMLLATIQREWRIVLGAAGTFGLLTLASGILFGFGQWALFLDSVNEPNWTLPSMVNWMGLAWRVAPASQPLIQQVALPVFALAGLALGAVLWAVRERTSLEGQLSVAIAWMVLASPNTHPYDMLVLAPALVYVSRQSVSWGAGVGPFSFLVTWLTLPHPFRWMQILALAAFAALCSYLLRQEMSDREPLGVTGRDHRRAEGLRSLT